MSNFHVSRSLRLVSLSTTTTRRFFSAKPPPALGAQLRPEVQENLSGFFPESAFTPPLPSSLPLSPNSIPLPSSSFPANTTSRFRKEKQRQTTTITHIVSTTPAPANRQTTTTTTQTEKRVSDLSNSEIVSLLREGALLLKNLESEIQDAFRAVEIRRSYFESINGEKAWLKDLPFKDYDYSQVEGACGENVVGFIPIPLGLAGPLLLDGKKIFVPMATTEGCLIASTSRGCRAISEAGGATTVLVNNGITRAPLVRFDSIVEAAKMKAWLENPSNFEGLATVFNSTSRFARLKEIKAVIAGRTLHLRFKSVSGDAMGMNMVSKAVERTLFVLKQNHFPEMEVMSLSGNLCTDKKPSAVNWIEGRGKSVVAEARLSEDIVTRVLKTSISSLVDLNINKNLVGSSMAGSIGGMNAHASNIVTAIFLATGQDAAQNVESSNCLTLMEASPNGKELHISCTMPSIEVGTVGGGTHLSPQSACLNILGVRGASVVAGQNAEALARSICASVMAGELSLMSALTSGDLVKSHLKHNRKQTTSETSSRTPESIL